MIRFFIIIINLLLIFDSFSIEIKYKFFKGNKYKSEATIQGTQYYNTQKLNDYKQEYKIVTTVLNVDEKDGKSAELQDDGYYYINNQYVTNEARVVDNNVLVKYYKDEFGEIVAPMDKEFPVYRNIPMFKEGDLKEGDEWEGSGFELQDLFNDKIVSVFPINVKYKIKKINNDELKTVEIEYICSTNIRNDFRGNLHKRIIAVQGQSNNILYFSAKEGRPIKEIYKRNYQFLIDTNLYGRRDFYQFVDTGERIWTVIENMNKDDIVKKIEKEIKENNIENVDIKKDDKGIKLSLENIQFEADSSVLTENEKLRLEKIGKILEKYKDKSLLIVGHTTDRGTEEGRKKLSVERANSVSNFLINKGITTKEKVQIMGKGGTEPIAPNSTEEGLRKNRRVEIYILEE